MFLPPPTVFHRLAYKLLERISYEVSSVRTLSAKEKLSHLWKKANAILPPVQAFTERLIETPLSKFHLKVRRSRAFKLQRLYEMHDKAYNEYDPRPYEGRVVIFRSSKQTHGIHPDPALGWRDLFRGELELREIPGHYINLFIEPSVRLLADEMKKCLQSLN